jgi:hypothetical protein
MMLATMLAACLANAPVVDASTQIGDASAPLPTQIEPLPLASVDDTLDVSGQIIAAREIRTRLTLAVHVNGAGPFQFVVDSGADGTVIGQRLASSLRLPTLGCFRLHGTAGATLVPAVHADSLRVGGSVLKSLSAPVLPEAAIGADGILGINALTGQRLKLDFDARTVTLEDAGHRQSAPAAEAGDIVVTARRQRGQLILAAASSANIKMLAVIDTGAELTVGNNALRKRVFGGRSGLEAHPVNLISVTGQAVVADLVVVPELTIGRLKLRDVPIAFADAPPFVLFGLSDTPAVLLGTDVLQNFKRITLDFRRRKVRFTIRDAGTTGKSR